MRSQELGRRYLAGLVMAMAAIYLGVVSLSSGVAWRETYHPWLVLNLLGLGLVPALAAFLLGLRAWSTKGTSSTGFAAVALVILLVGIAVWRTFVIAF
jgi:hypothetical protein